MRKKLATVTAHSEFTLSSRWPKWSQPAVTEPWPGPWLSCDLAVTEPWALWLSCDWAVTELWPLGLGAVTTVLTVSSRSPFIFSWVTPFWACLHHNHPFKLGLTNLDQKCKMPWLRSLLFCRAIDRGLQGQIWLKKSYFQALPLLEIHNHHITTRGPWVPRLFHGPDCFMVSILQMTYIPRLFHGTSCFTVSAYCAYIDLGSRGYFGD